MTSDTLTLERARALWWERQGLGDDAIALDIARAVGMTGWLRTLGGADVYIAARARAPRMTRAQLDAAVARGDLRVVPAVRGCIYLVPAAVVADLMALNAPVWRKQTEKELAKAGATFAIVERVAASVLAALTQPMTPDAIRKALGKDAIPSFGEAGKKVGLSSPLPLALRLLEFDGRIERTLEGGRLDSERYQWRRAEWPVPAASSSPLTTVIKSFLDVAGPSTLGHLSAWSGVPQRDLEPLLAGDMIDAQPIDIESVGAAYARPADVAAAASIPSPRGLRLLAFEDNYLVNHGGPAVVTRPEHHGIKADIWGSDKPEALGTAAHVLSRTIVIDGFVAGFWEVDPRANGAVWTTFDPPSPQLAAKLDIATDELARFLLEDVGNPRVFSLDTIEQVQERADRIKKLAGRSSHAAATKSSARSSTKPRSKSAKPAAKSATKSKSKSKPKSKSTSNTMSKTKRRTNASKSKPKTLAAKSRSKSSSRPTSSSKPTKRGAKSNKR